MNKNPISKKIITIIAVIIIFIMTAWALVSFFIERNAAYRSLNETANRSIERLSSSLVFPLWNFDDEQVDKILESELQDRNFTAIFYTETKGAAYMTKTIDGKIIHQYGNALPRYAAEKTFLVLKKEIIKGNENLGTVELHVTDYYLKQELFGMLAKIGLQTMLVIALIIPLLSRFFNRYIVQRIANIISGINEIKKSNYAVSIDDKGNDELSDIAVNINNMAKAISEHEQHLIQTQKAKLLGTLAGGLAHDFNNVLCGILGTTDILKMQINKISKEEINKRLTDITGLTKRAENIVRRLFTISRKNEVSIEPVDLDLIAKDVIMICENTFDKSVELEYFSAEKKPIINADPVQMEQVLLNLCINGYHAMTIMREAHEKQGGKLAVSISSIDAEKNFCSFHPEAQEGINYHVLSVQDTGVGMDSETRAKIFDPFFTTKEKDVGTGLGLAMVYNIVHQYKGIIDVNSKVGEGTAFNIYLPRFENTCCVERVAAGAEQLQAGRGLILVVDDEAVIRSTAKAILEECGHNVILACDGEEAVNIFKERHDEINAVLLDLQIPKKTGKEVFIEMKKIKSNVKVIITTGSKRNGRVDAMLDLGANGFIQKPYTAADIANALNEVLGGG